jgi:lipoprotein LprG
MANAAERPRRLSAILGGVACSLVAFSGCGGGSSGPSGPTLAADAQTIVDASAAAMGEVQSVEFEVERSGAPISIDSFGSIVLERIVGQFSVPNSAQAVIDVRIDDSVNTQLAAIAIDDEVWLSNPITGNYETLPEGYDIDPSRFFDPENGWRPLLANLTDVELIGIEDRDGDAYHVRGTAPAAQIEVITAGLVDDQDVTIDFWLDPVTGLVRAAEFDTMIDDATVSWALELRDYGESFDIAPPEVS